MNALSDCLTITRRYLIRFIRVPSLLVFSVIQPIMFLVLFRYVFGGAIAVPGKHYVSFLLPGIVAQTAAFGSFSTAIGLAEEITTGNMDRLRSMPIIRGAVLIGRLTTDTIRNTFVVMIMIGVGYLVGFRFLNGFLPATLMIIIAVAFGLAICVVSAFIALEMKDPESVQSIGLIWLFPVTFISAAFVPVSSMPGWLQAIAKANPTTIVVDCMRSLALGGPTFTRFLESLAWVVAILCVFSPLAVRAYKKA